MMDTTGCRTSLLEERAGLEQAVAAIEAQVEPLQTEARSHRTRMIQIDAMLQGLDALDAHLAAPDAPVG